MLFPEHGNNVLQSFGDDHIKFPPFWAYKKTK